MKQFIKVNLQDENHCYHVLKLLNEYMEDEMGAGGPMPEELGPKIIDGLKKHTGYLGFFVCVEDDFAALANCNLNFSTWKAKPLINIHDFIVSPNFRGQGIGLFLLDEIAKYAKEKDYCRVNLEVRYDNLKAQNLYKKTGFKDCEPPNYFWEKRLE
jgi:ribosomal protein S18 acetylase RimI-like enzyme